MSLLGILLAIICVGVLLWAVNAYLPMDQKVKQLLNIVVMVILLVWLLKVFGVWTYLERFHLQ